MSAVWGGTSVITPSEDSVETMKVVSNGYDAENGRFSGGTNPGHDKSWHKPAPRKRILQSVASRTERLSKLEWSRIEQSRHSGGARPQSR